LVPRGVHRSEPGRHDARLGDQGPRQVGRLVEDVVGVIDAVQVRTGAWQCSSAIARSTLIASLNAFPTQVCRFIAQPNYSRWRAPPERPAVSACLSTASARHALRGAPRRACEHPTNYDMTPYSAAPCAENPEPNPASLVHPAAKSREARRSLDWNWQCALRRHMLLCWARSHHGELASRASSGFTRRRVRHYARAAGQTPAPISER
jgi:hypothetical protein